MHRSLKTVIVRLGSLGCGDRMLLVDDGDGKTKLKVSWIHYCRKYINDTSTTEENKIMRQPIALN